MATCFDVAKYILKQMGKTTGIKLQKLVYYSQAWSLVWDEKPLFNEKIEAWVNGPVIPELYKQHKEKYLISLKDISRNPKQLNKSQKETIDEVIHFYGDKNPQWLSDLTHLEKPWRKARKDLKPNQRGSSEITLTSMVEYYSSIEKG